MARCLGQEESDRRWIRKKGKAGKQRRGSEEVKRGAGGKERIKFDEFLDTPLGPLA